jgi:phosphatidylserine decarboxylase
LKIHPQGWPFIAIFAAINAILVALSPWAAVAFLPLTIWCVAFFRDPDRVTPKGPGLVVSPADGRLLPVVQAVPPAELGLGAEPRTRLSIFMSVFNVHVNRVPADGTISALAYRPGKFFNASFDKASEHNERMAASLTLDGPTQKTPRELIFVQIAGLVARRIHSELSKGQSVCRGDRFGLIRFGSRLDVYLPDGMRVCVSEGQNVKAGETVLAEYQP